MRLHPTLIALAAALALPPSTRAAPSDLTVVALYVRLSPPGTANTAAFMTIRNTGHSDRKLLRAESPVARSVELHSHGSDHGVMRMRRVTEIELKAGVHTELKPGSYHVMLIDLRQPLQEGDTVPLTLSFDDGSSSRIDAPVRKPQTGIDADPRTAPARMQH